MTSDIIYSKIEYENAISAKKNLLESQANLLRSLQYLENYRNLRKKELILKIKLKKNLKGIKDNIKEIIKKAPKTQGVKDHMRKKKEAEESHAVLSVQSELEDIQDKLRELG